MSCNENGTHKERKVAHPPMHHASAGAKTREIFDTRDLPLLEGFQTITNGDFAREPKGVNKRWTSPKNT